METTHIPRCRECGVARVIVVRDEEVGGGWGREALGAVPRHVLDGQEGAVGDEDHVEEAVADDGAVGALDDSGQDAEGGRQRVVVVVDEHRLVCAFHPVDVRSVDGGFDIGTVEVDLCSVGEVVERPRETEDVPQQWASCRDLVDVPAWIDQKSFVVDGSPEAAAAAATRARRGWKGTSWWVCKIILEVRVVATGLSLGVKICHESVIERYERIPEIHERHGHNVALNRTVAETGVINHDAVDIIVRGVVFVEHCISNIWNVIAGVGFTRYINSISLHGECFHEIFKEAKELRGNIFFRCGCWRPLTEASPNGP